MTVLPQPVYLYGRSQALTAAGMLYFLAMAIWGIVLVFMMVGFIGAFILVTALGGDMYHLDGLTFLAIFFILGPLAGAILGAAGAGSALTRRSFERAVIFGFLGVALSICWVVTIAMMGLAGWIGFPVAGVSAVVLFALGLALVLSRQNEFLDQAPAT